MCVKKFDEAQTVGVEFSSLPVETKGIYFSCSWCRDIYFCSEVGSAGTSSVL